MNKARPKPRKLQSSNLVSEKIDRLLDGRADAALEKKAGLPTGKIGKVRHGLQYLRIGEGFRIAEAFGISLHWLADDAQNGEPQYLSETARIGSSIGFDYQDRRKPKSKKKPSS